MFLQPCFLLCPTPPTIIPPTLYYRAVQTLMCHAFQKWFNAKQRKRRIQIIVVQKLGCDPKYIPKLTSGDERWYLITYCKQPLLTWVRGVIKVGLKRSLFYICALSLTKNLKSQTQSQLDCEMFSSELSQADGKRAFWSTRKI